MSVVLCICCCMLVEILLGLLYMCEMVVVDMLVSFVMLLSIEWLLLWCVCDVLLWDGGEFIGGFLVVWVCWCGVLLVVLLFIFDLWWFCLYFYLIL